MRDPDGSRANTYSRKHYNFSKEIEKQDVIVARKGGKKKEERKNWAITPPKRRRMGVVGSNVSEGENSKALDRVCLRSDILE